MDLLLTVISWILFVFYMVFGIALASSYVGWLFLLQAILVMPIRPILNLWKAIGKVKPVKYLVMAALLCLSVWRLPAAAERVAQADQTEAVQEESGEQTGQPVQTAQSPAEAEEIQQAANTPAQGTPEDTESVQETPRDTEPAQGSSGRGSKDQPGQSDSEKKELQDLTVHFIDVGQGDCTLLVCGEDAMLIDAGEDSCGTEVQKYLYEQGISKLNYVICTHPDADHIGAMDVILYKFDCDTVFMTDAAKETKDFEEIKKVLNLKYYKTEVPVVGDTYPLGSASFQIISPALVYSETNNNSIVVRVDHGTNHFLFTGDAELQAQQEMYYGGYQIRADVMKVPHHGGNSGFQQWFFEAVQPTYAVISCGKMNSYGHPHEEVLKALKEMRASVYRTDEQGTVTAVSNGYTITFDQGPSDTWRPGYTGTSKPSSEGTDGETGSDRNSVEAQTAAALLQTLQDGLYVVNGKNGKIHIKGRCPATDPGADSHMNDPIPCNSFEKAEDASFRVDPEITEERRCKLCFP